MGSRRFSLGCEVLHSLFNEGGPDLLPEASRKAGWGTQGWGQWSFSSIWYFDNSSWWTSWTVIWRRKHPSTGDRWTPAHWSRDFFWACDYIRCPLGVSFESKFCGSWRKRYYGPPIGQQRHELHDLTLRYPTWATYCCSTTSSWFGWNGGPLSRNG